MSARPETWPAANVNFVDTMRLSLCRRAKEVEEEAKRAIERDSVRPHQDYFWRKTNCEEGGDEVDTWRVSMEVSLSDS